MLKGFLTESYYITLIVAAVYGGGNDGIGKARYRHERTGARDLGYIVKNARSRQHGGNNPLSRKSLLRL